MAGKGKSLNVVVAAALVAYEAWQRPEEPNEFAATSPAPSEP